VTGLALIRGPAHDFPGAGIFVIVVLAVIVLIFIRVYGGGNQPGQRISHRSRRRTVHHVNHPQPPSHPHAPSHPQATGENHGHKPESHHHPQQH
jgi:hypothetical protein